jgi:hypothetical protein
MKASLRTGSVERAHNARAMYRTAARVPPPEKTETAMKIAALALAATLGAAGLGFAAAPASAQSVSFTFGVGHGFGHGFGNGFHPGFGHGFAPRRVFVHPGHGYYAPYPRPRRNFYHGGGWVPSGYYGGPVCRTVIQTRWSNRWGGYVQRPVRVCH